MSNILIIKHGSLGDIAQASGAIQDIFENHKNSQIYLEKKQSNLEFKILILTNFLNVLM